MPHRILSKRIYLEECLGVTAQHFDDLCVTSWTNEADHILLEIEPRKNAPPGTLDEFLNYVLAASLEARLS